MEKDLGHVLNEGNLSFFSAEHIRQAINLVEHLNNRVKSGDKNKLGRIQVSLLTSPTFTESNIMRAFEVFTHLERVESHLSKVQILQTGILKAVPQTVLLVLKDGEVIFGDNYPFSEALFHLRQILESKIQEEIIEIAFDNKLGLYRSDEPDKAYKIGGKRKILFTELVCAGQYVNRNSLVELLSSDENKGDYHIGKEIRKINEQLREKLSLKYNVIYSYKNEGYAIDDSHFSIIVAKNIDCSQ